MRALKKNKRKIYYKLYTGKEAVYDENGFRTGEYRSTYGDLKSVMVNYSASRGAAEFGLFGMNMNYSKSIIVDDTECPISETSILWVDKEPLDKSTNPPTELPHNYVVVMVGKSINYKAYAIKEVSSNG